MDLMMTLAAAPTREFSVTHETLLRGTLAVMFTLGSISLVEPSPYDALFLLLVPIALFSGLTISRPTFLFAIIVSVFVGAEAVALMPYLDHRAVENNMTPTMYTILSAYCYATALLLALILSTNTKGRITICLKAYAFSCVIAGFWSILSYLNVGGLADNEPIQGRVAGLFKDPNVNGSYCILGTLFYLQSAVIGTRGSRLWNLLGFFVAACGVFLSFSRGSWSSLIFSMLILGTSTALTDDTGVIRRRLWWALAGLLFCAFILAICIMLNANLRDTFEVRAQLVQDYDGGTTGRFGNQLRSISMMLELPLGFGPFRFPLYFGLNPHNSYIGAFASAGWIGGLDFLLMAAITAVIAFRLSLRPSPFLREAQVVSAAFLCILLQAFQIDIDHWRFAFFMLGAVWGLEAARLKLRPISRIAPHGAPTDLSGTPKLASASP